MCTYWYMFVHTLRLQLTTAGGFMCVSACVTVPCAFYLCVCTYVSEYVCFNESWEASLHSSGYQC